MRQQNDDVRLAASSGKDDKDKSDYISDPTFKHL
jgi:hypothetical protein